MYEKGWFWRDSRETRKAVIERPKIEVVSRSNEVEVKRTQVEFGCKEIILALF